MTDPTSTAGRGGTRQLGLWMATALVIGNQIGSGIFLLPAALTTRVRPRRTDGAAGRHAAHEGDCR
jgi:hypothetical protein